MDKDRLTGLSALLPPDNLFAGKILVEDKVDSTNTRLKALAAGGAPAGTAMLAEEQTGGRGTHGRSFCSPRGEGLYLSVLLRPHVPIQRLLTLTGWAAVAARRAVAEAAGAPAEIKWLNDLTLHGRKLAGILTELAPVGANGTPDWVVVGIGVNVSQSREVFAAQGLGDIAASLAGEGWPCSRTGLALALLRALDVLARSFPEGEAVWLAEYRAHCSTVGRRVSFQEEGKDLTGTAVGITGTFALRVAGDDGREWTVSSGTVSLLD